MKDVAQQNIWENQQSFLDCIDYAQFQKKFSCDSRAIKKFQKIIYDYYKTFGRAFVWRQTTEPYKIVVSEVMLQQTQTSRVGPKFDLFIKTFPDFTSLAHAPLHDVIACWQGLGYNRRAKYLREIAQKVVVDHGGVLPNSPKILQTFPGIGSATAASICAFAFNEPTVFIETNIRTVFTKFFFSENISSVHDKDILPLVATTLDKKNARVWYYALTDYGVGLKKFFPSMNAKSAHYNKQSRFEGSDRQIRGKILKLLTQKKSATQKDFSVLCKEKKRLEKIILQLQNEKLIIQEEDLFKIF